jgi:hypothetical protein
VASVNTFTSTDAPDFGSLLGGINVAAYTDWITSILEGSGGGNDDGGGGNGKGRGGGRPKLGQAAFAITADTSQQLELPLGTDRIADSESLDLFEDTDAFFTIPEVSRPASVVESTDRAVVQPSDTSPCERTLDRFFAELDTEPSDDLFADALLVSGFCAA